MRREREAMDVKQGQDVDQHVIRREPPGLLQARADWRPGWRACASPPWAALLYPSCRASGTRIAADRRLGKMAPGRVQSLGISEHRAQFRQLGS